MPASNHTNNLGLPIYAADDHVSVLGDFNSAMRKLDTEVSAAVEAGNSASTDAANALAAANAASEAASRAKDSADSTLTTAAQASSLAGAANTAVTELRARVTAAEETSSSARSTATAAETAANTAVNRANTALDTATAASNVANNISNTAEDAASKADAAATSVRSINERQKFRFAYFGRDDSSASNTTLNTNSSANMMSRTVTGLTIGMPYTIIAKLVFYNTTHSGGTKTVAIKTSSGGTIDEFYFNHDDYIASETVFSSFVASNTSETVTITFSTDPQATIELRRTQSALIVL